MSIHSTGSFGHCPRARVNRRHRSGIQFVGEISMAQKEPGTRPEPRALSKTSSKGKSDKKQERSKSSASSAQKTKMRRAG